MRLVGATNSFIRGPFVLEGAIKGVLGGLLALLLCWAGFPSSAPRSAPTCRISGFSGRWTWR